MKLYYKADCPYCQLVLRLIHAAGESCELLPHTRYKAEVDALGGKVPILVDRDQAIVGSAAIIEHLEKTYGARLEGANPIGMRITYEGSVAEAEAAVTEALKAVGFGVLTRIDVAETLKKKLGLERPPYVILGACNPKIAAQALAMEPSLGLLLPCNVVVYEEAGRSVVSVIQPVKMLALLGRTDMLPLAEQVKELLEKALASLGG